MEGEPRTTLPDSEGQAGSGTQMEVPQSSGVDDDDEGRPSRRQRTMKAIDGARTEPEQQPAADDADQDVAVTGASSMVMPDSTREQPGGDDSVPSAAPTYSLGIEYTVDERIPQIDEEDAVFATLEDCALQQHVNHCQRCPTQHNTANETHQDTDDAPMPSIDDEHVVIASPADHQGRAGHGNSANETLQSRCLVAAPPMDEYHAAFHRTVDESEHQEP